MAWTVTTRKHTIFGNERVMRFDLLSDSATYELATGLNSIHGAHLAIKSLTSAGIKMRYNALSAATASQGTLSITGCTSGDEFYLTVFGR